MKDKVIFLLTIMLIAGCGCPLAKDKKIIAKKKQLQTFIDRLGAKNTKAGQAQSFKKKMENHIAEYQG